MDVKPATDPLNDEPDEIELTEAQKQLLVEIWKKAPKGHPPSLIELTEFAWGKGVDSRSRKGRAVREFLLKNGLKARLARDYIKAESVPLTEEEKEYIRNNCVGAKPLEIARLLLREPKITAIHPKVKMVEKYLRSLNPSAKYVEEIAFEDYVPPKTIEETIDRVNQYIHEPIAVDKLSGKQKKDLRALMGFLHRMRFQSQINAFETMNDRRLFESEFVRCTYDKWDLTEEEVDQYIVYSTEVIIGKTILRRISNLERQQDEELEEKERLNMALVEAVKTLRAEHNQCVKRQNDLLSQLKIKRSERMSGLARDTASIANLFGLWKEEETRKKLIEVAKKDQQDIEEEIKRLTTMDEIKARIIGLTREEALFG